MEERIRSKDREKKRRAENESNLELDLIAEAMEKIQKRRRDERHSNIRQTSTTTSNTTYPPRHADSRRITVDNNNNYAAVVAAAGTTASIGGGTAEGEHAEQELLASAQATTKDKHISG